MEFPGPEAEGIALAEAIGLPFNKGVQIRGLFALIPRASACLRPKRCYHARGGTQCYLVHG